MKNRLDRMELEGKTHYKLYKAGRNWVTAGITVFTVGAGLTFSLVDQAKAATNTGSSESDNSSSVSSSATTSTENTAVLKTTSAAATSASATAATSAATTASTASDSQSTAASNTSSTGSTATSATTESTSISASSAQSTAKSAASSADSQSTQTSSSAATSSSTSSQATSTDSTSSTSGDTASTADSSTPVTSTATSATTVKSAATTKSAMVKTANAAIMATAATSTTTTITDSNGVTLTIIDSYGKTMTYKTNDDTGVGSAGLQDLYALLESSDTGIAEGEGLVTMYVQDSAGNYLTDNTGQRVNLLYMLLNNEQGNDEALANNFTITYTNVAGTQSTDVSAIPWDSLTDAGTYQLTLTSAGLQAITELLTTNANDGNYDFPDGETIGDFTPTFDSASDYNFQIKIIPATLGLVNNTLGFNEIKVSSDTQNYNGTISQSPKSIQLMDGTSKTVAAITITNGIVTAVKSADGSSAKVGDVVFTSDDFSQIFTYTYTSNADNLTGADVGKYTISLSATGLAKLQAYLGQNFIVSAAATTSNVPTLTINKTTLTVSTATNEVTYNGKAQTTAVTVGTNYDGIVAGDYTTTTGTNAGVYQIVPTYTGTKAAIIERNYTSTPAAGTLIIDKAALIVTIASLTGKYKKIYDSTTGTYINAYVYGTTASVTSGTNYDGLTFSAVGEDGVTVGYSNVGTYSMTGTTSDDLSNYQVTYVGGTITITPALLTVSINTQTFTYNSKAQTLRTSVVGGTNYDGLIFTAIAADGSGNTSYTNAGTYLMTGTTADDTSNYIITYKNSNLIINPVVATVTVTPAEVTYDKQAHGTTAKLTTSSNPDKLVFTAIAADGSGKTTYTNVGSYTMTGTTTMDTSNYTITYVTGDLIIDPAALTVTINNQTLDYNGQIQGTTAQLTSGTNYDNVTFTAVAKADSSITGYKNVGSYDMTGLASGTGSTNYTVTYVDGTLTINKAALTVRANDNTIIYDGQAHGTDTTVTSGTNYDNLTFDAVAKTDGTTAEYTNVGSYIMTGKTADDTANYDITYVDGTLTINKAQLTVSVDNLTQVYDSNTFGTTAKVTSGNDYDKLTFNVVAKSDDSTTGYKNVGSYTMVALANETTAANYDINYVDGTITITPAALTVAVNSKTFTYDSQEHSITASVIGGTNYDNLAFTTVAKDGTATSYKNVGSYAMTGATADNGNGNYTITYVDGTLAITPAALTVTVDSPSVTYDGQEHGTTASVTTGNNYDNLTFTTAAADGTTSYKNVGRYVMTGATADNGDGNYAITYVDGTLAITPAALTVTVNDNTTVYDSNAHGTTTTITGGTDYDDLVFTTVAKSDGTTTGYTNVGSYTMTGQTASAGASNYDITYVDGTLAITPEKLTVTVNEDSVTYDANNHDLTAGVTSGTNYDNLTFTTVGTDGVTTSYKNAGSYTMTGTTTGNTNNNYDISYVDNTLTITPAALTVTVNKDSAVYDAKDHSLTAGVTSGTNYDNLTFTTVGTDGTTTSYKNVGNYTMTGTTTGNTDGNYTISYVNGTLAITPAALTVTVNKNAATYDGQAHGTTASVTDGDNYDGLTFTTVAKDGTATSYTNVGTYTMTGTTTDNANGNYNISYVDGDLVITPAVLTVTVNDNQATYDGQAHGTTVTVAGNNVDNLTFAATGKDGSGATYTNAGTYAMTSVATGDTANYTIKTVDGQLIINKAAATINIADKTYWYDGTQHDLTASVTGMVNGEKLTYTLTDGASAVGTKTITAQVTADDVAQNYDVTVNDGTLTVGDVTVTYIYQYMGTDGTLHTASTNRATASHGTDATASDYLSYTTTPQAKTGYSLVSNNTGLAANGTLTGIGGNVVYTYQANTEKATVTYVDQTTGKTLTTADLTGAYGTTDSYTTADKIAVYENLGYQLVDSDFPTTGISYDQDGVAQSYTVNLAHRMLEVTVTTPGKPGEPIDTDNPNGPKYPSGTTATDLTSTSHRTISYVDVNGKTMQPSVEQSVTYQRTAMIDIVTGAVTYADWTTDQAAYQQVDSPVVTGYTADQTSVAQATAAAGASDTSVKVVYTANTEHATITYVDQTTGKTLTTDQLSGQYGTTTTDPSSTAIANYKKQGYELVSSDVPADGIVYDQDGVVKQYTVTLKHRVTTVTPSNPGTPGQPIDADNPDGPKYPNGTGATDLTATSQRTINYVDANGKTMQPSVVQTVTYHRTATIDVVTGEVTYSNWTTAQADYQQVVSPTIKGYQTDQTQVDGETVTVGATDATVNVVYTANTEHATVSYVDQTTGKLLTMVDLTGAYGTNDAYTTAAAIAEYEKAGYVLSSSDFPTSGIVYDEDGTVKNYTVRLTHASSATTETKTIKQTIHYQDNKGNALQDDTDRTITFTRTKNVDQVTGEATYSGWSTTQTAAFDAVTAPKIAKYHTATAGTQAVTVSADSLDDEQTIVYTLDDDNDSNGKTPTDPKDPNEVVVETPDQITPEPQQPNTETAVTNKKNQQSSVVKKNTATVTTNENHVQPLTDHSTNQQAESKQATLPQTGDDRQASVAAELLGLTAAALLAGLGMILRKRHE